MRGCDGATFIASLTGLLSVYAQGTSQNAGERCHSVGGAFDGNHANVVLEMLLGGITANLIHNGRE
jgi:hypothetical protein